MKTLKKIVTIFPSGYMLYRLWCEFQFFLLFTGKYFAQIEPGDFASCASFMDKFYVIDIVNTRIAIFAHDNAENKWKRTLSHITLHGDIVTSHDKVCVHRTGVYVSSFTNHCVCVYSHQGVFIQQVGDKLFDPYLCGVDAIGNHAFLFLQRSILFSFNSIKKTLKIYVSS